MKIHPDAEIFPRMSDVELDDLACDIAAYGLRETIKTDATGEFLVDGRNREEACAIAGVEPRYEALPVDTDIFTYVISVNLHRRHLTDAQRREIVRQVAVRNPTLSNRQIAKLAHVNPSTVDRTLSSGAAPAAPEHKITGADGKSYPTSGKLSSRIKDAIITDLKSNPLAQRDVALKHGVSVGTVSGIKNRLKKAGKLVHTVPVPTIAEQVAKRATLPSHELTREERGMGTREYGGQLHSELGHLGYTNDDVHRMKYGRIQGHTPAEIEEQQLVRRFTDMIMHISRFTDDTTPTADDLDNINTLIHREPIVFYIRKHAPKAIEKLNQLLQKLEGPASNVISLNLSRD